MFAGLIFLSGSVFADSEKLSPEYLWVPEANEHSSFQAEVGGGLLDDSGITGSKGSPVYVLLKANYAINPSASLYLDLPLAGTISTGPDGFGIGNISIGGNYQFLHLDRWSMGAGVNLTFPTSQNESAIGVFTRNFTSFVQDQYAVSPYLDLHVSNEKLAASFDIGFNEQIFSSTPAGLDKTETVLFYDAGLSLAVNNAKDFWATLEFGGYSTLTYSNNNTELFGGPGFRYQDHEFSYGLHLMAPFSSPARDQIDLMILSDIRFKF